MSNWKELWKKHEKQKNGECGCDPCVDSVSGDCKCGCTDKARESVRLTDAEIAHDVVSELTDLCNCYSCLCSEGCDCSDKLHECELDRERIREYLSNNND